MRIPAGMLIYKEAVEKALPTLESIENCTLYGARILYIKREKINFWTKPLRGGPKPETSG